LSGEAGMAIWGEEGATEEAEKEAEDLLPPKSL